MAWCAMRNADVLLSDLGARSSLDLGSLLEPPAASDWARCSPRYEFSLAPGPEFDDDAPVESDDASTGAGSSAGLDEFDTSSVEPADRSILPLKPVKTIAKAKTAVSKTPSSGSGGSGSLGASQAAGLSHTKLCRDRLNSMFDRLRGTLPNAPAGVEVKHKAQVLDYAISVLKGMVARTTELEIELAVSSNRATMDWISKLVARVDSFPAAAAEVMRLFSIRRRWRHAELWTANRRPMPPGTDLEKSVSLEYCLSVTNDSMGSRTPTGELLEQFSTESSTYSFGADEGVQGRVWSSMRPEWLVGLDQKSFRRSALARRYGIKVCLAVPVTITGKIDAVLCFYDTKHRQYDTQCLDLAMRLAWALGNTTGGKRAQITTGTSSGVSNA